MECREIGIDPMPVLQIAGHSSTNSAQLYELSIPQLTQDWQPADTHTPLGYLGTMPQLTQGCQIFVPTSGRLGYQDHLVEATGEQKQRWEEFIDYNRGDLIPKQRRPTANQARRQRQTKGIPEFITESGHKRTRVSRSYERETEKKQPKRQKAEGPRRKMLEEQRQNTEEWILVPEPIEKQGRNAYRIHACQELMAMQQSPRMLSMIARELSQDYDLDNLPEQENLGIEAMQRRQHYREWRDKPRREHTAGPHGECAPMINEEQIPLAGDGSRPLSVGEEASRGNHNGQSEAKEERTGVTNDETIQKTNAQQNLNFGRTENQSVVQEGFQMQPGTVHTGHDTDTDVDWETMMNKEYEAIQWLDAEQSGAPVPYGTEELDVLFDSPSL
ncbi:hypothetical protein MMC18_004013 [Xylographa bjoerkii]|nr:hypothetical protein [Xylographa bjoerkii]